MTIIDPATLLLDGATLADWLATAEPLAKREDLHAAPRGYGKHDRYHVIQAQRIVALIQHIRVTKLLAETAPHE